MNIKKEYKRAFTLIELLVVIAIIGILATVVVVNLGSARAKARDAKRLADLKSIQTALELYYDANTTYPRDLCVGWWSSSKANWTMGTDWNGNNKVCNPQGIKQDLESGNFISSMPIDPINNNIYNYMVEEDPPVGAALYTKLETKTQDQYGCGTSNIYRIKVGDYPENENPKRLCQSW